MAQSRKIKDVLKNEGFHYEMLDPRPEDDLPESAFVLRGADHELRVQDPPTNRAPSADLLEDRTVSLTVVYRGRVVATMRVKGVQTAMWIMRHNLLTPVGS